MRRWMTWRGHFWIALLLRVYLGGLFVLASLYKIQFPAAFADSVVEYQLVPYALVPVVAVVLPWLELLAGLCLVLGVRAKAAAWTVAGLLAMFSVAVASVLWRGLPVGCGCFEASGEPASWLTVARDLVWLGMALYVIGYDRFLHLERVFLLSSAELDR
ncbi:MAG: DoxX family membrane protein [Desulfomicrobiaceae bacterium]|nr:DoxX family membrane protein [Desulfomicrobiaceae bacterium]